MILTKTPYRVSLFGGGTDYNAWLKNHHGATVSFTIPLYSNILIRNLSQVFGSRYRIRYFERQECNEIDKIRHPIIRYAFTRTATYDSNFEKKSLDLIHSGDLPSMTGMGTSSCFTVGLLKALDTITGRNRTACELAKEAIYIEQHMNGEPVGSQDQIAAAVGGLIYVEYTGINDFEVIGIKASQPWLDSLLNCFSLFYTGLSRDSKVAASDTTQLIEEKQQYLFSIRDQAVECKSIIEKGVSHDSIGLMLNEAWTIKKKLSGFVTNTAIDQLYESLLASGATGGKLLGAGGGGFLLMYTPKQNLPQFERLTSTLNPLKLQIERRGSSSYELP